VNTLVKPPLSRVGLISVHTSPLDRPGTGDSGGLNVYVREVATRLARRGVRVDVFTRRTGRDTPDTVALADGVDVHHLDAGPPRSVDKSDLANHLCAFVLAMRRHPTAGTHDVLHTHYWLSGWVGRRLAHHFDVPFVHTFHTLGVLKNATLAPGDVPEPPLRLVAEARIAADADRLLVLTCGEARLLHRAYQVSGKRQVVVRPGVDLTRFAPGGDREPGPPRLLFAGRLQPLKGPDLAIRILAEVRRRRPDARLEVIGGASGATSVSTGLEGLAALAAELDVADAVCFRPAVDQDTLAAHYRAADVVLVPSRSETFGLVALEAQASGVPVVAARVPGLEAVVASGGTLVDGHDPADHADAVLAYLDDPVRAAEARVEALATARRSTWDATVDRLVAAYDEVCLEHAGSYVPAVAV
jgi:D-inositol-3-phosphate glycosyltransferase